MRRLPRGEGEARAVGLAERLGLTSPLLHEPLRALSKGSLQKVVVIQALLGQPALVVLDEPFAGLDVDASQALRALIDEATGAGSTVVFSDHRERDIRPGADVVWSVADGGVHEHAVERPSSRLPELPGVLEALEASGRLRLVVGSEHSDHVLATLVAHAGT